MKSQVQQTAASELRTCWSPFPCGLAGVATVLVVIAFSMASAPAAHAEAANPGWEVTSTTLPTDLRPGGTGIIEINVYNVGARGSSGTVTMTDTLPPGIVATEAGDAQGGVTDAIGVNLLWDCSPGEVTVVTCNNNPERMPSLPIPEGNEPYGGPGLKEDDAGTVEHIDIAVKVETSTTETLMNHVTVSGGGAMEPASTSAPITVSATPPSSFGFQQSDGWFSNADGTVDTQAGSHPYEFTYSFALNTAYGPKYPFPPEDDFLAPVGGEARDLAVNLPPGFIGNPAAVPRCNRQLFEEEACPASTQVGIDMADVVLPTGDGRFPLRVPFAVYNLVPPPGIPAQFAFVFGGNAVFLDAGVRSGGDYGITEHVNNLPQQAILNNTITFWGEPSNPAHDNERVSEHGEEGVNLLGPCKSGCPVNAPRVPFLTLPTACEGPQMFSESLDTWETVGFGELSYESHDQSGAVTGFTGCDHLGFGPSISVAPDTSDADTPAGLTVDVRVPEEGLTTPGALATSDIKDTTVVLPSGVVINPGQAAGLQACQQGPTEPTSSGAPRYPGRDDLPLLGEDGEEEKFTGPADCPNASKVGTLQISTPLLKGDLEGSVYVLQSTPPNLKLLFAASGEGVNIKLVGDVSLCEAAGEEIDGKMCEAPGQIITRLSETPELPFTDFKLSFSGGAQAALATPTQCGEYTTTSDFTPWSTLTVGDVFPSSNLAITSGSGGGACPSSSLPFSPSLIAGATTDQAGGFTDFSVLLQRGDDQQRIAGLQFKAPEGLTGELSKVPLCTNAQAETNTCPEASKIGHTVVEVGPGPYPLVVPEPGRAPAAIYLTETYGGAPFGLSIVVPLEVGPFVLPTQRIRAKIEIDPHTAQITVTTNPFPQVDDGIPTDLREVDAVIEHPEFMINPTNCDPSSFSGTAYGAQPPGVAGSSVNAAISSRFQVGSCRSLEFAPKFSASTSGKTSKADGASLTATVSYPNVPQGTDADIALTKVELPKQLPSRLTTLQKACTSAQFESNPAACPSASLIGHATVHTPLLPVALTGPAIFVSHGGEAFPSLEVVLQGDGVTIDLVGTTFISKAGITSTTFKTVPDAPFSTFELALPEGPYSALAANGDLCTSKLAMPVELIGQNGAVLKQSTPLSVTGCAKAKTLSRAQQLAQSLRACRKQKGAKRQKCESAARERYGPRKKPKSGKRR
jgi:hypothetical protein